MVTLMDYVHGDEGNSVVLDGVKDVHYTIENGNVVTNDKWERDIIPGLGHMFAMSTDYARNKLDVNETVNRSREIATKYAVYDPVPVAFSGEAYLEFMPEIRDVHETWFTDFVTGEKDLDQDWDDYLAALDRVGLDEVTDEVNDFLK